jgi:hypothetical protein
VTVDRDRIYNAPVFDYARIDEYSRPEYITNIYSYYGVSGGAAVAVGVSGGTSTTTSGATTTGGLQRLAQQQARRQVRRWKDRRLPTPQQGEEHTQVRRQPRAQRRLGRVKQLLQPLTVEPVLRHRKNERRVRKKRRSRQRQGVVAKLKRNPKLSELHRKERPRARKQRNQLGAEHEVAKPGLLRKDHKNNESGLTVFDKQLRQISPVRISPA